MGFAWRCQNEFYCEGFAVVPPRQVILDFRKDGSEDFLDVRECVSPYVDRVDFEGLDFVHMDLKLCQERKCRGLYVSVLQKFVSMVSLSVLLLEFHASLCSS